MQTEVRKTLNRRGLSLSTGAQLLGVSRRQMAYYASGEREIPAALMFALKGMPLRDMRDKKTG